MIFASKNLPSIFASFQFIFKIFILINLYREIENYSISGHLILDYLIDGGSNFTSFHFLTQLMYINND